MTPSMGLFTEKIMNSGDIITAAHSQAVVPDFYDS